ncbi:MAG: Ig-like domain-containing protein [Flavobacteriaceae bacterium]|jgi:hypothetical protein|nr:Ig-like domain-containing protein [Flavobacteriaceae bacterium]
MRSKFFSKIILAVMMTAAVVMTAHPSDDDLAPAGIIVSPSVLELHVGDKQTLTAEVTPADAPNKNVTWGSINNYVATVNPLTGEVRAVAIGKTIITARANGEIGFCVITVSPHVYVAGYYANDSNVQVATLWKNGVPQDLTDGKGHARAESVFVYGNDVYVAGNAGGAVLWKNGVKQTLSGSSASFVFVSDGGDVYVAGQDVDNKPVLWKNGVKQTFPPTGTDEAFANSVFVYGNDVYVAGYGHDKRTRAIPLLWKNGELQTLDYNKDSVFAHTVFVSNNDVYVAGYDGDNAVLWKNGVQQIQHKGSALGYSVFVSGGDVYVTGIIANDAVLWKNGVKQILPSDGGEAFAVFVSGSDVYVTGYDDSKPVLWKNGVKQTLSTNRGIALSVFVE